MPDSTPLASFYSDPLPEVDPVADSIPRRFVPPEGYFVSTRQGMAAGGIPIRRVSRSRRDVEVFDAAAARGAAHRAELRRIGSLV